MFNYINEVRIENEKDKLNENSYYAYFRADIHCFINLCDPADINNYGVDFRNRDDYRCFAKDLKFLAKNLNALEKASELRQKWLVEYKRKTALCEELRWAF